LITDVIEVPVVAEDRHGIAYGRVNSPIGSFGNVDGHLESFEE
jgi:hypothetical protein